MDVAAILVVLATIFLSAFLITSAVLTVTRLRQKRGTPCSTVLIVVGSGGHTKEVLTLTEDLGSQYSFRYYVVADSDSFSLRKIHSTEQHISSQNTSDSKSKYAVYAVPRSREVKQSWLTTPFTTLCATLYSLRLVFQLRPQAILCNGPGTCVPICYAAFLSKMLGLADTKIAYVESICRVETLSLSAILLYPIADSIIVQWPELLEKYPKCKYIGRVV